MKEKLREARKQIEALDTVIMQKFAERMEVSEKIAGIKREGNMPIQDDAREREVVEAAQRHVGHDYAGEAAVLSRTMMALSRAAQRRKLHGASCHLPVFATPGNIKTVAFQGVTGAFSEEAAARLFPNADLERRNTFEEVFSSVQTGKVDAGVVPIENLLSGAINEVYELLRRYGCSIVAEEILPIEQCLLGVPGAKMRDIHTVRSHPEALKQCLHFINAHDFLQEACGNTAIAAQSVAEEEDITVAAIASRRAAGLYGLEVLEAAIQNEKKNSTRFIALRPRPEAEQGADRLALSFVTRHRSGALADALLAFSLVGLNLTRILSQPDGKGGYRFFVDVEGSPTDESVRQALSHAANSCEYMEVLGTYRAQLSE